MKKNIKICNLQFAIQKRRHLSILPIAICKLFIACCLLLTTHCQFASAQTTISLKAATNMALQNNLSLKNEKIKAVYQQQLIKTAKVLPPTNVFTELGQINSFYIDTKFGIAQTFSTPKVYTSQKNMLTEEWKSSALLVNIKEVELTKQVALHYYQLLYLHEKKKLLLKIDSVFAEFLTKSILRFNTGESNVLEKATAENHRGEIGLQLSQLQQDMELLQLQFQLLLNSNNVYVPDEKEFKMKIIAQIDTSFLQAHPAIQFNKQQHQIAVAATQVEKSMLLPNINLGYNIMSMRGSGADNKTYNTVPRFQSIQLGLGIPLFNTGQKEKISAAQTKEKITNNEYELNLKNFEMAYKSSLLNLKKYDEAVTYFEKTAIKNATLIINTANKQFLNGDINFLEWGFLMNQATNIHNSYLDALLSRNNSLVEINYFINL